MSNGWSWMIITVCIQIGAQIIKPRTYGRGKYLTMPLRKKWPRMFNHIFCRTVQVFMLLGVYVVISSFWSPFFYIYCLILIAWSVDDYFTDDENKRKFKEFVRNKIKWKMKLPQLVPVGGKVSS